VNNHDEVSSSLSPLYEEASGRTLKDDTIVDNDDLTSGEDVSAKTPKKIHKLSLTKTEDFNEKLKRRGVIYIARIPPRMTPTKIKSLLSEFGEVTRIYLVEEDSSVRKRRKKEFGGSGSKRYVEGWVEFACKRKAKHVTLALNNTPISNHKRNPHYGESKSLSLSLCISLYHRINIMTS
jgi:ESF2/ABP1 family protein